MYRVRQGYYSYHREVIYTEIVKDIIRIIEKYYM